MSASSSVGTDPSPAPPREEPHVAPLNALVRRWRQGPHGARFVPWVDPQGPGTAARVLLLLESPGPATVRAGAAGVSRLANDDPTSRGLRSALAESGLDQSVCLRANVIPWHLGARGSIRRAPTVADLEDARPALSSLVGALPRLRVVVTFGTPALLGWMRLVTLSPGMPVLPVLAVPHPSPANGHRREEARTRTVNAMRSAARLLDPSSS